MNKDANCINDLYAENVKNNIYSRLTTLSFGSAKVPTTKKMLTVGNVEMAIFFLKSPSSVHRTESRQVQNIRHY